MAPDSVPLNVVGKCPCLGDSAAAALLQSISDAVLAIDAQGTVRYWNPAAARLFGYSEDQILGRSAFDTVIPERRRSFLRKLFDRVLRGRASQRAGIGRSVSTVALNSEGRLIAVDVTLSRLDCGGDHLLTAIVRRSVSPLARAGETGRRNSLLMDIIDHIPHFVFWKDQQSVYMGCNTNFAKVAGLESPRDIVGKTDYDLAWSREEGDWYRKCDREVMSADVPWLDIEESQHSADGVDTTILTSKVPLHDEQGQVIGMLGIYADVTHLKEAEHAAEAANRAKSLFLANMSHEIRTPMTSILGYCEVLLESQHADQMPKECADAALTIHRNAMHLLDLINAILDLSKVEAEQLELAVADVAVEQLIREVLSIMRGFNRTCGFTVDCEAPVPKTIRTDPLRLRQVLINVVANAFKFTTRGEVRLRIRHEDGDSPRLVFDVEDTGIGMEPAKAEHIFEPFRQADASLTRRYGGSGLGLALARQLARLLGGEVELVKTEYRRGSIFRVWMPCDDATPRAPLTGLAIDEAGTPRTREPDASAPAKPLTGCRILLAEDSVDNRRLIVRLVELAGGEIETAENGRLAVEAVAKARSEQHPYDVILMDIQMPVLDGYAATCEIRKAHDATPIIAFTAHAFEEERERCLEVGCDGCLTKPINRNELIAVIREHAGEKELQVGDEKERPFEARR